MRRITINLDHITDADLQLARSANVMLVIDDILRLSPSSRDQQREALQQKIQAGTASVLEEQLQVKLLEPRKAEWIRVIYKNLTAIEQELQKRKAGSAAVESPPAFSPMLAESPRKTVKRPEPPAELLDMLATQKPPTRPTKPSLRPRPAVQIEPQRPAHSAGKDIVVTLGFLSCIFLTVWYVIASDQTPPPLLPDALETGSAPLSEEALRLQQQMETEFEAATQEIRFGDFKKGRAALSALIKAYPQSTYSEQAYLVLADTLRQRERNASEALNYYQRFLEEFPHSRQTDLVQLKMGFVHEDLGDFANAENIYRLLIKHAGATSRVGQLASERLHALRPNAAP